MTWSLQTLFRAIPIEKLVGGMSKVSFLYNPASIFHYFLGYPAVKPFKFNACNLMTWSLQTLFRAIPVEKLVRGMSEVSFSYSPAAIFHYFLRYPAVIFPINAMQKKKKKAHQTTLQWFWNYSQTTLRHFLKCTSDIPHQLFKWNNPYIFFLICFSSTDRQKVAYMSPHCYLHRLAQKLSWLCPSHDTFLPFHTF